MSAEVQTKLVVTDETGDELEVEFTPRSECGQFTAKIKGNLVYLTPDDADALHGFLGEHG